MVRRGIATVNAARGSTRTARPRSCHTGRTIANRTSSINGKRAGALYGLAKSLGLLYARRSFLRSSGYLLSARRNEPVRADGSPIPWMNYGVISFLESRLTPDLSVFEFGSGNSTRFFAARVRRVVSVECDRGWYDRIRDGLASNVELILCEPFDRARYLATLLDRNETFDIIVVDGEERDACLRDAPSRLREGGVIVLDDADRRDYQAAVQELLGRGFRKLDFDGLKPVGVRAYRTSVVYRPGNVLGL